MLRSNSRIATSRDIDISKPRRDRAFYHQWRQFGYLMKAVDPLATLPIYSGSDASVPLADLVRWGCESPGEVKCKLHFGIAREIGTAARAEAGYRSLLDQGVTDVRLLFGDWDYRQWQWWREKSRYAELDQGTAELLIGGVANKEAKAIEELQQQIRDWIELVRRREGAFREFEETRQAQLESITNLFRREAARQRL